MSFTPYFDVVLALFAAWFSVRVCTDSIERAAKTL
jgi:hypothetical protein